MVITAMICHSHTHNIVLELELECILMHPIPYNAVCFHLQR